jgi:flagellar protein FlaG
MSSSKTEGGIASGLVRAPAALAGQEKAAEQADSVSGAERGELENAVSQLNDYAQNVQRDLQFEVDSERGEIIVRVVDQQTQKVIRQIPDELALRLAENLQQDEPLTLLDVKV